ncbi:MAG: flippase [Opitutaceae bacterium]|nr:flippase [Opitutaceae bacterium]
MTIAAGVVQRFLWFSAERGLRLGIAFVVGAAVARHLGPQSYGMIAYGAATVAVFSVVFGLGMDAVVVRDLSRDEGNDLAMVGTVVVMRALSGLLAAVCCVLYAFLVNLNSEGLRQLLLWQSLVLLFGWGDIVDAWFQARPQLWRGICLRISVCLVAAGIRVFMIFSDAGAYAFVLASVVESALIATGLWILFRRSLRGKASLTFEMGMARDVLKRGWPLALSAGLVTFVLQGDRIILGHLASAEQVGIYAASARFLDVLLILPMLMGMAVQRLFAQEATRNVDARTVPVRKILTAAHWLALVAALLTWLASQWIMPKVFGASFREGGAILAIQSWVVVFVMQVALRTRVLVAEGSHRLVLLLSLVTAVVQAGLLPFAIGRAGAIGAAYATLAAWVCGAWIAPLLFRQTRWFVVAFFRGMVFPFRS